MSNLVTNLSIDCRGFGGTIGTVHVGGDSEDFNGITEASAECYDTAAVGQTASSWSWRGYQNIIKRYNLTR